MKVGVLRFSYSGFRGLAESLATSGVYDANVGDNVQSLAVRRLLIDLGVAPADIVPVDRDTLRTYEGPPVRLVMNGCFYRPCFPLPPQISPVFVGFQANESVIAAHRNWFARHQPIGCRDGVTAAAFHAHGIAAEVTGCLSLTLPQRAVTPAKRHLKVIFGAGAGAFPWEVLRQIPPRLLADAEFVYQRKPVHHLPLRDEDQAEAEAMAADLLDRYAREATLVVTSLHHAAAPCIAMGIPVVLCRRTPDARFSFLETLMPVDVRPFDAPIDWSPQVPDLTAVRSDLRRRLARALDLARVPET